MHLERSVEDKLRQKINCMLVGIINVMDINKMGGGDLSFIEKHLYEEEQETKGARTVE